MPLQLACLTLLFISPLKLQVFPKNGTIGHQATGSKINAEGFESLMINMWPVFPVFYVCTSVFPPVTYSFYTGALQRWQKLTDAGQVALSWIKYFGLLLPSTVKFSHQFWRWIDLVQGRRTSFSPKRSHHVIISNSSSMATVLQSCITFCTSWTWFACEVRCICDQSPSMPWSTFGIDPLARVHCPHLLCLLDKCIM